MTKLVWQDEYSVGVKELDYQHEELLDLINRLYDESPKKDLDSCFWNLNKMVKYAELHFSTEEKLMETYGYEGLEMQRGEHDSFTMKVFELNAKLEQTKGDIYADLIDYLKEWYVSHILGTDKGYIELFKEKGLK